MSVPSHIRPMRLPMDRIWWRERGAIRNAPCFNRKSSKMDFPVFSKCIYTCWMALGFEMFLSELWQTSHSFVGSTRSFDQWNVSLVLKREGSVTSFPRLEDFVISFDIWECVFIVQKNYPCLRFPLVGHAICVLRVVLFYPRRPFR